MRHRLIGAILLLYPRRIRRGHGAEIVMLIDDLIAHGGKAPRLFIRLAADGLVQRIASTASVWTAVAVLATTSFAGLAVSEFAAATGLHHAPRPVPTAAPARHTRPRRPARHDTRTTLLAPRSVDRQVGESVAHGATGRSWHWRKLRRPG